MKAKGSSEGLKRKKKGKRKLKENSWWQEVKGELRGNSSTRMKQKGRKDEVTDGMRRRRLRKRARKPRVLRKDGKRRRIVKTESELAVKWKDSRTERKKRNIVKVKRVRGEIK